METRVDSWEGGEKQTVFQFLHKLLVCGELWLGGGWFLQGFVHVVRR